MKLNADLLHSMKASLALRWHLRKNRGLNNRSVSIISNNCIAGIIYHDCGLQFLSPTINLWFPHEDFFRFSANLKAYSTQNGATLSEISETGISYPIGLLTPAKHSEAPPSFVIPHDNTQVLENLQPCENLPKDPQRSALAPIKIYFQHYDSFAEAKAKWEERERRINYENICMIFECATPVASDSSERALFEAASYKHKVMVTHTDSADGEHIVHLPVYADPDYAPGKLFGAKNKFSLARHLDDFNYVAFLNKVKSNED